MHRSGRTDRNRDFLALQSRSCSSAGQCPRDILSESCDAVAPLAADSVSRVKVFPAGQARTGQHQIDGDRRTHRRACAPRRRNSRTSCSQLDANTHSVRAAAAPRQGDASPSTAGADAGNSPWRPDLGRRVVRQDGPGFAQGRWRLELLLAVELESCRRRIRRAAPGLACACPRCPCVPRDTLDPLIAHVGHSTLARGSGRRSHRAGPVRLDS